MCSQSLIHYCSDSENWHITSSCLRRWYLWSEWQSIHSILSHTFYPTFYHATRPDPDSVIITYVLEPISQDVFVISMSSTKKQFQFQHSFVSLYMLHAYVTSHICSHSAQRRDPGPSVIWTGITIRVCHTGLVMSKMLHEQQSHAIKHVLYYGVR